MANLTFHYGVMKTAKTASLLVAAYNFQTPERRIVLTKPGIDDRDGNLVSTRAGIAPRAVDFLIDPEMDIRSHMRDLGGPAVRKLFVDEAQFLTVPQVDQLADVAMGGVGVDAFGLRTDFQTRLFPATARFFEIADEFVEYNVPCSCDAGTDALFNLRYVDGVLVLDGDQVAVEKGEVRYECYCRACYIRVVEELALAPPKAE